MASKTQQQATVDLAEMIAWLQQQFSCPAEAVQVGISQKLDDIENSLIAALGMTTPGREPTQAEVEEAVRRCLAPALLAAYTQALTEVLVNYGYSLEDLKDTLRDIDAVGTLSMRSRDSELGEPMVRPDRIPFVICELADKAAAGHA